MNRAVVFGACLFATGCPGPEGGNPERVWLNIDVVETRVKLQDTEPAPF
jgi:hypothetical protein